MPTINSHNIIFNEAVWGDYHPLDTLSVLPDTVSGVTGITGVTGVTLAGGGGGGNYIWHPDTGTFRHGIAISTNDEITKLKEENETLRQLNQDLQAVLNSAMAKEKVDIIDLLEKKAKELREKAGKVNIFDGKRIELLTAAREFDKTITEIKDHGNKIDRKEI